MSLKSDLKDFAQQNPDLQSTIDLGQGDDVISLTQGEPDSDSAPRSPSV